MYWEIILARIGSTHTHTHKATKTQKSIHCFGRNQGQSNKGLTSVRLQKVSILLQISLPIENTTISIPILIITQHELTRLKLYQPIIGSNWPILGLNLDLLGFQLHLDLRIKISNHARVSIRMCAWLIRIPNRSSWRYLTWQQKE